MEELIEKISEELQIDKSSWVLTKFGDVAIQQKQSVDRENTDLTRYVKGEHMGSEDLHLRSWGELKDEYLGPAFIRRFDEGDILYGSRRTYLRKVVIAPFSGITSNTTFVIKANEENIDKRLLPFIMMSEGFTENSIRNSKGSVNPYINWKDIANYQFLLPPKDQQAQLAKLLWAMDEVIEREKQVVNGMQISSKVIAVDHLASVRKNKIIKLGDICQPKQWKTISIKNLTEEGYLVYGGNGIIGRYVDYNHKYPVIAVACRGEYCGSIHLTEPESYITGNSMCLDELDENQFNKKYLFYYLYYSNLDSIITGSAQPQIIKEDIARFKIREVNTADQIQLVLKLDQLWDNLKIANKKVSSSQSLQKSLINQVF